MSASTGSLTTDEVVAFARSCFPSSSDARIGAEVEFFVVDPQRPGEHVSHQEVARLLAGAGSLGGSTITFEPGGQLELVSPPGADLEATLRGLRADHAAVRALLAARGLALVGSGFDAVRPERRVIRSPRYDAMEAYFDIDGAAGRAMMCRTAAIQVNLDFGPDPAARWRRTHALAPVGAAAFANSPLYCGAPSGWRSTRLATWNAMDRTRTAPVGGHGADAWAEYLLEARVMLVRRSEAAFVPVLEPMTFRSWMESGRRGIFPTADDLVYHASTLFPPVRPRGWMELRMCDALPDPWWEVPIAFWAALLYGDEAGSRAERAAAPVAGGWYEAARIGLSARHFARAAAECFDAAIEGLSALGAGRDTVALVETYADRYVRRGRTPADDVLEQDGSPDVLAEVAWI